MRAESINNFGVVLNENLACKPHYKYTENRIAKNIGLLSKSKPLLNKESLLSLYY